MTDENRRAFEDAWTKFIHIRYPKTCYKSVDGFDLVLLDSYLAGCVSWYKRILKNERSDLPPEHLRYLVETLPFVTRLSTDDPDEVWRAYFGLWLEIVQTMLSNLPDMEEAAQ